MIIDPGVHTPEIDTFNLISKMSDQSCTYHLPAMFGFGSFPETFDEILGIIILGSAASVYDQLPWQRTLENFVGSAIDKNIPVLGCCYGLQMLAFMYGGQVGHVLVTREKLKGVRRIRMLENSVWPSGERSVVVTHAEMVTKIPSDFALIATSNDVQVEGLRHKSKPVYGFQFHPEATRLFLAGHEMLDQNTLSCLHDGHKILEKFVHTAAMRLT